MVSRSGPPSVSTSGSVELLDDIEEDLVSLSSITSSKPTISTHGPARLRSASLQDLPRPVSCPMSLWSRSRDSGVPLSGSSPSVCSDLLAVIAELRAELCERDETIHVLRQSHVTLLETCASLENALDQARLCSACASRRMLEGSSVPHRQKVHDMLCTNSPGCHSPVSLPPRELSSDAAAQSPTETDWSGASRESSVCSDIAAADPALSSSRINGPGETLHKKERFPRTAPGVNGKTESLQDSRRNMLLKDEGMQELVLCCLDAVNLATHTALQRSQMLRRYLKSLSQGCPSADVVHLLPT